MRKKIVLEQEHDGVIYQLTSDGYWLCYFALLAFNHDQLGIVLQIASNPKFTKLCYKLGLQSPLSEEKIKRAEKACPALAALLRRYIKLGAA